MAEFDVTQHILVPHHEIMNEEEIKKLLAKYKIEKEQLPKILSSDACARVLGAKPGQIIKITRKSSTAGESITYRIVIEG